MSSPIYWDVMSKKEYETEGETRTIWFRAGAVKVTSTGRMYLHLFHQPSTDIFIFEADENSDFAWNVCTVKEYPLDGETKKKWYTIGHIDEKPDGAMHLLLFQQPNETFEIIKEKEPELD